LIAATASAAYLNPALALAQKNFNTIYVLGPIVGAIVGVNVYMWVFGPTTTARAEAKVVSTVKVSRAHVLRAQTLRNQVSFRNCEIPFSDGGYLLMSGSCSAERRAKQP